MKTLTVEMDAEQECEWSESEDDIRYCDMSQFQKKKDEVEGIEDEKATLWSAGVKMSRLVSLLHDFVEQALRQTYTFPRNPRAWPLDRRPTWGRMRRHVCVRQHRPGRISSLILEAGCTPNW